MTVTTLTSPSSQVYAKGASGLPTPVDDQGNGLPTSLNSAGGTTLNAAATGAGAVPVIDLGTDAVPVFPGVPTVPWSYAPPQAGLANTTTAVLIKTAAAAGLRNYITDIELSWSALTTGGQYVIRDGASGTVIWRVNIEAAVAGRHAPPIKIPPFGTAATLLEFAAETASGVAGAVWLNARGYVA